MNSFGGFKNHSMSYDVSEVGLQYSVFILLMQIKKMTFVGIDCSVKI